MEPTLSVVAPVYNEAEAAAAFCALMRDLEQALAARGISSVQKVIVDDGSRDDSVAMFTRHLTGEWKLVELSRNFGKEVALFAGMDHADGDLVLLMDADLQHTTEVALRMVDEMLADPDLDVVYARTDRGDGSWQRGKLAQLFYGAINASQRFSIPRNAGDFRIMRRRVVDALLKVRDRRRFNKGLYAWAGFRQKGIDYRPAPRATGRSKWSRLALLALSLEAFTSFSVLPLRLATALGLLAAGSGAVYGLKIIFEVMFYGIAVPGYPSIVVAVTLLGGVNLALLGLIGEYVWAGLSEAKDRPIYLTRNTYGPIGTKAGKRVRRHDGIPAE